jgi:UDP-2,3-diacylglucosamine pyrophosphatase LpxH
VHLGCGFSRAQDLFDFVGRVEPERLYLVGDIIDGWKVKRNFVWTDTASFVVRRILGMLKRGTRVRYVTGNHDEFLRAFSPHVFGQLHVAEHVGLHSFQPRPQAEEPEPGSWAEMPADLTAVV